MHKSEAHKALKMREHYALQLFGEHDYRAIVAHPALDIGYRGSEGARPLPGFLGLELGDPFYDTGATLPYANHSFMTVHSSHVLEHTTDPHKFIRECFRVLNLHGHLILTVPHQYLYEKKQKLPSHWNKGHHRFYTPSSLLWEVERALAPNTYRVLWCRDNDWDYNYKIGPDKHAEGCYEIELVLRKIKPPEWSLA